MPSFGIDFSRKELGFELGSDRDPDPDPDEYTSETESEALSECDPEFRDRHKLPIWENPTIMPIVQKIIEEAARDPHADSCSRRALPSPVSHVPLDIAIQIVELTIWLVSNIHGICWLHLGGGCLTVTGRGVAKWIWSLSMLIFKK
jgi:hypothetical protein